MAFQRKHVLVTIGVAVVLISGFVRLFTQKAKASQEEVTPVRTVAVALAQRGPIANSLKLSGEFRAYQVVDVHAKVAGAEQSGRGRTRRAMSVKPISLLSSMEAPPALASSV